jgi:hypothetical protein
MRKLAPKLASAIATACLVLAVSAAPAQAVVRFTSWNDDCGPHFYLRSGPQGYSSNFSIDKRTSAKHTVNWGYVDYPYYQRSYEIPYWVTRQVYGEATLRWIDRAYLICYA